MKYEKARQLIRDVTPTDPTIDLYHESGLISIMCSWGASWDGEKWSLPETETAGLLRSKATEVRRTKLAQLRAEFKKSSWNYSDIASRSNNSTSWVGVVMRGGYPHYEAHWLTRAIANALEDLGFSVPKEIGGSS